MKSLEQLKEIAGQSELKNRLTGVSGFPHPYRVGQTFGQPDIHIPELSPEEARIVDRYEVFWGAAATVRGLNVRPENIPDFQEFDWDKGERENFINLKE